MKSLVYLLVSLGFAPTALAGSPPPDEQEMLWPLPVEPRAITGTFMEFRQGRFHSGLDLRTQGREGFPVRAPAAGSIVRLRTSPTGYGIAVYLQLEDGRMLVFAHLSVLSDRLREPILRAWASSGRYQQYLYLKPGELTVERGELLALSGSTGVGAPHLHLEVRDAQERPLNPQLHGFAVPDTVAPKVTAIRVIPLGAGAHVDGERAAKVFEPGASFSAAGTLGVMVRIDDRTGYSPFRVGPLGVVAEMDGVEVYRLENEVFAFSQTGQMRLEKFVDPENAKKSWLRLYRRPGNELSHRSESGPPGGTFVAHEGVEHELSIRAWDVNGQTGKTSIRISGSAPESTTSLPWYALEGNWASKDPTILQGELPEDAFANRPGWRVGVEADCAYVEGTPGPWICGWMWIDADRALHPGGVLKHSRPQEDLVGPEGTSGLKTVRRFEGEGVVIDKGMTATVEVFGTDRHQLGFFLADESGKWSFLGPVLQESVTSSAWSEVVLNSFGTIAVARDTTSPELGAFRIGDRALDDGQLLQLVAREQQHGVTLPNLPAVRISLKDPAAGIVDEGPVTLLDGEPYPARWEPEDEVLVYEWWLDPGPGEHLLTVRAQDRLGNESEAEIRLIFPR